MQESKIWDRITRTTRRCSDGVRGSPRMLMTWSRSWSSWVPTRTNWESSEEQAFWTRSSWKIPAKSRLSIHSRLKVQPKVAWSHYLISEPSLNSYFLANRKGSQEVDLETYTKWLNSSLCNFNLSGSSDEPLTPLQCNLVIQEYLPRSNVVGPISKSQALDLLSEALFDRQQKHFVDQLEFLSRNFDTFAYVIDKYQNSAMPQRSDLEMDLLLNSNPTSSRTGGMSTRKDIAFVNFVVSAINHQLVLHNFTLVHDYKATVLHHSVGCNLWWSTMELFLRQVVRAQMFWSVSVEAVCKCCLD